MPARPTPARRLATACAALLAAAGALAGSAALPWYTAEVPAPGRAPVHVVARGADLLAGLQATALLALAGVAAAVALGGVARRALGGVLVLAALWLGGAVVGVVVSPPDAAAIAALPGAPAGAGLAQAVTRTAAPLLAAVGVVLLAAAGLAFAVRERHFARLGARYGRAKATAPRETDPDRAAWEALDAGRDPTVDP